MNKIICTLFLLIPSMALASEAFLGSYTSVSEADCDLAISLKSQGQGVATQICTREDGSHQVDEQSFEITWVVNKQGILLSHNNVSMLFQYSENLSCGEFGKHESNAGIYTTIKNENSLFSGYGGKFWKSPGNCK